MMRAALNALALGMLAGAGLAACSANIKPNTVTFPGSSAQVANTSSLAAPAQASTSVPAAATATSVTSAPAAPAATSASPSATAVNAPAATSVASAPAEPEPAVPATSSASPAATAVSTPSAAPVTMPTRGMLMSQVEKQFGAPEQKLSAVPDPGTKLHPPITRWVYPQYVVYFEYNYVVHSVLKSQPFSNPDSSTN